MNPKATLVPRRLKHKETLRPLSLPPFANQLRIENLLHKQITMPSDLILITGVTGHVGFKVLVDALELGYAVRAVVRDASKEAGILATKSIKALNPGARLSFVAVQDNAVDGAYDEVVKGVKYIIHVGAPVPDSSIPLEKLETALVIPAVKGVTGILQSAYKTTGIERVVITGSAASIIPTMAIVGGSDEEFDETSRAEALPAPFRHVFVAYCASKIASYNATKDFLAKEKPAFDVVTIMPVFIIGKNELVTDPKNITQGSNGLAFRQILGEKCHPVGGATVHLDDVAKAHFLALDPKIPGNSHFILSSNGMDGTVWGQAIGIVAKNYPRAVATGTLLNNGVVETVRLKINARKAEEAFGLKFLNYEEQVKSVTGHYLELVGSEAA